MTTYKNDFHQLAQLNAQECLCKLWMQKLELFFW